MANGIGALGSRPMGRVRKLAAVATAMLAALSAPAWVSAENNGPPLIRIPPAQLPPLPSSISSANSAKIVPRPRSFLPAKMLVLPDQNGSGTAMYGVLTGTPGSAAGIVLAMLGQLEVFDTSPSAREIATDESDWHAQALFTATTHGRMIIGVAAAAISDTASDVSLVYDNADAIADSFRRLQNALTNIGTVEIGVMDNSVCDFETTLRAIPTTVWQHVITVTTAADARTPVDAPVTQALVDKLSNDTARPWHLLSSAEWK